VYKDRYWKKEHFEEMEKLKVLLTETYPEEQVPYYILLLYGTIVSVEVNISIYCLATI